MDNIKFLIPKPKNFPFKYKQHPHMNFPFKLVLIV